MVHQEYQHHQTLEDPRQDRKTTKRIDVETRQKDDVHRYHHKETSGVPDYDGDGQQDVEVVLKEAHEDSSELTDIFVSTSEFTPPQVLLGLEEEEVGRKHNHEQQSEVEADVDFLVHLLATRVHNGQTCRHSHQGRHADQLDEEELLEGVQSAEQRPHQLGKCLLQQEQQHQLDTQSRQQHQVLEVVGEEVRGDAHAAHPAEAVVILGDLLFAFGNEAPEVEALADFEFGEYALDVLEQTVPLVEDLRDLLQGRPTEDRLSRQSQEVVHQSQGVEVDEVDDEERAEAEFEDRVARGDSIDDCGGDGLDIFDDTN